MKFQEGKNPCNFIMSYQRLSSISIYLLQAIKTCGPRGESNAKYDCDSMLWQKSLFCGEAHILQSRVLQMPHERVTLIE